MISKRGLFSVLLIGLIGVAAGAGTFAYFSDTEEGDGVFMAGTIDIAVNDLNPWVGNFSFSDMKPCKTTGYADVEIKNVGTNDARIFKLVEVTGYDTGIMEFMCPYSNEYFSSVAEWKEEVTLLYDDAGEVESWEVNRVDDIHNVTLYTIELDGEQKDICGLLDVGDEDIGLTVGDISGVYMYLGTLVSGDTLTVDQSYKLHGDAGNEYQGDEFRFNMKFVALQTNDFETIVDYIDLENAEVVEHDPEAPDPEVDFKLSIGELTNDSVELCISNQGDMIIGDALVNITLSGLWGEAEHQKNVLTFTGNGDLFEDQTACHPLYKEEFSIGTEYNLTSDLEQIKVEIMGVVNTYSDFNQTTEEPVEDPLEDWNLTIVDCNKTELGFEIKLMHDRETPIKTESTVNVTVTNGFERTNQTTVADINDGDNWTASEIEFELMSSAFSLEPEQVDEVSAIKVEIKNVTSIFEFTVDETEENGDNGESDEEKTNGNDETNDSDDKDNDTSPGAPTTPTTPTTPSEPGEAGFDLIGLNLSVGLEIAVFNVDGDLFGVFDCFSGFVATAGLDNEYKVTLFVSDDEGEPFKDGLIWLLDESGEELSHNMVGDWSDSSDVSALELNESGTTQFVFTPSQPVEVSWLIGHENSKNNDKVYVDYPCLVAENPGIEIIDEERDLKSDVVDGVLTHDLINDIVNKLMFSLVPADERDMALDDMKIVVTGNITGETVHTNTSLKNDVQTGLIEIIPADVGEKVAEFYLGDKDSELSEILDGIAVGYFNSIELEVITKNLELTVETIDDFIVGEEITFKVTIDGEPVQGALIYNTNNNATTNQEGAASLTFDEPGVYQINVEKDGEFNNGVQTLYNEASIEIEVTEEDRMIALILTIPLLIGLLLILMIVRRRNLEA